VLRFGFEPALGFSRRSLRATMAALCILSLAACSDGYPTEDVPQIDPARMTPAQLLEALNALGEEPHLGKRWRYALHANCELEVSVRNGDADHRHVVLEGGVVEARSVNGLTEILLIPEVGGDKQAVTVFATRRWTDMVQAKSLLARLQARCGSISIPTA
jgi:hypothetical protein